MYINIIYEGLLLANVRVCVCVGEQDMSTDSCNGFNVNVHGYSIAVRATKRQSNTNTKSDRVIRWEQKHTHQIGKQ